MHLQWCHNHAIRNQQALQQLRMTDTIKQQLRMTDTIKQQLRMTDTIKQQLRMTDTMKETALRLFASGVGVAGVKRILEDSTDNISCVEVRREIS